MPHLTAGRTQAAKELHGLNMVAGGWMQPDLTKWGGPMSIPQFGSCNQSGRIARSAGLGGRQMDVKLELCR
jgi:hypothetical protein